MTAINSYRYMLLFKALNLIKLWKYPYFHLELSFFLSAFIIYKLNYYSIYTNKFLLILKIRKKLEIQKDGWALMLLYFIIPIYPKTKKNPQTAMLLPLTLYWIQFIHENYIYLSNHAIFRQNIYVRIGNSATIKIETITNIKILAVKNNMVVISACNSSIIP